MDQENVLEILSLFSLLIQLGRLTVGSEDYSFDGGGHTALQILQSL